MAKRKSKQPAKVFDASMMKLIGIVVVAVGIVYYIFLA